MNTQPFEIHVPQVVLDDLGERLERARPVPHDDANDWGAGTNPTYLAGLIEHWKRGFDWRAQEAQLNQLHHFRAEVNGTHLHFVHEKGKGPNPIPIVLTHGFPDSYLRFRKLIPLLTDPGAHGSDPSNAFDVVVPSIPGFGFSDRPAHSGTIFEVGSLWHALMHQVLGYEKYAAHGGDFGSIITEQLARDHSASLIGIHLTDVPITHGFQKPDHLSSAEQAYFARREQFQKTQGAYNMIQSSRPETLAHGLNDSPIGLAAWLVDLFEMWSDCGGDLDRSFTKDEILTTVMTYWSTETIASSFQGYVDMVHASPARWILEKAKEVVGSTRVPAAFAICPKDIGRAPREYAERYFNVQRYTELPRGGHFAAAEEPELIAEDIRAFFRPFRNPDRTV